MVNFDGWMRKLVDAYSNIKDKFCVSDEKERDMLIAHSLFAEACAAYRALREVNGMGDEPFDKFLDKYCINVEKRHECRTFLESVKINNNYKDLVSRFAKARNSIKSNKKEDQNSGLNNLKNALFDIINLSLYSYSEFS